MRPVLRAGSCTGTEAAPATLCATHSSGFSSSSPPKKTTALSPTPLRTFLGQPDLCFFFFFSPQGGDRGGQSWGQGFFFF